MAVSVLNLLSSKDSHYFMLQYPPISTCQFLHAVMREAKRGTDLCHSYLTPYYITCLTFYVPVPYIALTKFFQLLPSLIMMGMTWLSSRISGVLRRIIPYRSHAWPQTSDTDGGFTSLQSALYFLDSYHLSQRLRYAIRLSRSLFFIRVFPSLQNLTRCRNPALQHGSL